MSNWQDKDGAQIFTKEFESFDLAWDFMHFLAKLCRSTSAKAITISNQDQIVKIRVNQDSTNGEKFMRGVNDYFNQSTAKPKPNQDKLNANNAVLFCDGGSRGNPGPSATGYVIYDSNENELARGGEYLGVTTNNQAEYHSLKAGIEKSLELGVDNLTIKMDSQLVVRQIKGAYKVKNRDLWPLFENIKALLDKLYSYEITHVPRELNKVADSIANQIMDENLDK